MDSKTQSSREESGPPLRESVLFMRSIYVDGAMGNAVLDVLGFADEGGDDSQDDSLTGSENHEMVRNREPLIPISAGLFADTRKRFIRLIARFLVRV